MASTDDQLEERVARIEALLQGPRDLAEDVPYRPALWQQNWKYAATDDRALIAATCTPGVMGPGHLLVHQRDEGPNLSVDVDPGIVCVPGEEEYLSRFICPLKWKVNLPVGQGPAAGSQRYDTVAAVVTEVEGTEEATWELQVFAGPVRPAGEIVHPDLPAMAYPLCWIGPITSGTTSIVNAQIGNWRRRGNAAPLSGVVVEAIDLPYQTTLGSPGWSQWGPDQVIWAPSLEVNIVCQIVGVIGTGDHNQFSSAELQIHVSLDNGVHWIGSQSFALVSNHMYDWRSACAAHFVRGSSLNWIRVKALTNQLGTPWLWLHRGKLITTITPTPAV